MFANHRNGLDENFLLSSFPFRDFKGLPGPSAFPTAPLGSLWPAADGNAWTCHPPHSPGPTPLKVTKSGRKRQGEILEHITPTEQQKSKHSVHTERTMGYFKSIGIFHGKKRQNVPKLYKWLLVLSHCSQSPRNALNL